MVPPHSSSPAPQLIHLPTPHPWLRALSPAPHLVPNSQGAAPWETPSPPCRLLPQHRGLSPGGPRGVRVPPRLPVPAVPRPPAGCCTWTGGSCRTRCATCWTGSCSTGTSTSAPWNAASWPRRSAPPRTSSVGLGCGAGGWGVWGWGVGQAPLNPTALHPGCCAQRVRVPLAEGCQRSLPHRSCPTCTCTWALCPIPCAPRLGLPAPWLLLPTRCAPQKDVPRFSAPHAVGHCPPHPQHLFLPPQILEDLLEIDRVTAHF